MRLFEVPTLFLDIETIPFAYARARLEQLHKAASGEIPPDTGMPEYAQYKNSALSPFESHVMLAIYKTEACGPYFREAEINRNDHTFNDSYILGEILDKITTYEHVLGDRLSIVGCNTNFLLNFLYERMCASRSPGRSELYKRVLRNPLIVDLLQLHLPLNGMRPDGLNHDVLAHAYGLEPKSMRLTEVMDHYLAGRGDKIQEYSTSKFIYPKLYDAIVSDGLVSSKTLRESIKWYNSERARGGSRA